jgi:hypothetical protein
MKIKAFFMTMFAVCMVATTMLAQDKFEGIIRMTNDQAQGIEGSFYVKGNLVLIDADTGDEPVKMLSDRTTGNMTIFMERNGKKVALKMGPEMYQQMGQMVPGNVKEQMDKVKLTFTGKTKKIDGYTCEQVVAVDGENKSEAWITKELGITLFDIFPMMNELAAQQKGDDAMIKLFREGMVMEATTTKGKSGKTESMTMRIEEKNLSDDLFSFAEEGYKTYDMTNMMQLMMEAQNDPEKMKELQELMQEFGGN